MYMCVYIYIYMVMHHTRMIQSADHTQWWSREITVELKNAWCRLSHHSPIAYVFVVVLVETDLLCCQSQPQAVAPGFKYFTTFVWHDKAFLRTYPHR